MDGQREQLINASQERQSRVLSSAYLGGGHNKSVTTAPHVYLLLLPDPGNFHCHRSRAPLMPAVG